MLSESIVTVNTMPANGFVVAIVSKPHNFGEVKLERGAENTFFIRRNIDSTIKKLPIFRPFQMRSFEKFYSLALRIDLRNTLIIYSRAFVCLAEFFI